MKVAVIIQARMGSTRLSGKVMKDLFGKSVLAHDIERVRQAKRIDDIIIATTVHANDDIIVKEALSCGVKVFRGSEEDVLSRYYYAAQEYEADIIIRITSDCPLIDPFILDEIIDFFNKNHYDIVSNAGNDLSTRTYPRGLDVEIFSFASLEMAFLSAKENYQREHVTPYIYENSKNIFYFRNKENLSKYRWTLDTEEDWEFVKQVYGYLYHGKHDFYFYDIMKIMSEHPELYYINSDIEQKEIKPRLND